MAERPPSDRLLNFPAMANTREEAWNLLNEFTKTPHLVKHGLGVETAMRMEACGS